MKITPSQLMEVRDSIASALVGLGDTPGTVAASLITRGIKGRPGNCRTCPIAAYLATVIPEGWTIDVHGRFVSIYMPERPAASTTVTLPGACQKFIRTFDDEHGLTWPTLLSEVPAP